MLLTLTTTYAPATDLGFLLHKHPERSQTVELPFGQAHVFYPEANAQRCTAALLLEVDPVGLVRGRRGPDSGLIGHYVNDRPYVASSLLSVAIARVFGTALSGNCAARPELVERALPLEATLAVLPCRGGERLLRELFEPLGYAVEASRIPLDPEVPQWGESRYFRVKLSAVCRLTDLLSHLYVLIPVLDDEKHYWVGNEEVEKLLRHGEGWLGEHPQREAIALRYLARQRGLARQALERLTAEEEPAQEEREAARDQAEGELETPLSLNEQRLQAVAAAVKGCKSVVDLGCGDGKLIKLLLGDKSHQKVVGVEVSLRALEIARDRIKLDRLSEKMRTRVELLHGSLLYRDARLTGFDAATVVEVIEHLDPPRLTAFERALFEHARPARVVLTTPNAEYNVKFESLPRGRFRHADHRFEWTRAQLREWAEGVCARHGYEVRIEPVGAEDPALGAPTQLAVFTR
jgi:3' terminal RNA ribose 2'-O-methyltransferase Hen1